MALELIVLTLNIWGIPYISKDLEGRIEAIAKELSSGKYHLVALQEVWTERDFQLIKAAVRQVLPFSHYFYSGVAGSGLCVFSKFPIERAFYHSWRLNGYVHRIQHGDWFGGKGVGMVRIAINGLSVNFYVAHLHAEYNRAFDDYLTHRIIQAFDTAQFIESTRGDSAVQILAGDLNTEPGDLAYRIIVSTAGLQDFYDETLNGTNACAKNTYSSIAEADKCPGGKRIDYILVRSSHQYKIKSIEYDQPLPTRVPDRSYSYSDHEAVQARIKISNISSKQDKKEIQEKIESQTEENKITLSKCVRLCDQSLEQLSSHRKTYSMAAMAIVIVLLNMIELQAPYGLKTAFLIAKLCMAAAAVFFIFMATIWNVMERHAILSGKLSMEILLSSIEKIDGGINNSHSK